MWRSEVPLVLTGHRLGSSVREASDSILTTYYVSSGPLPGTGHRAVPACRSRHSHGPSDSPGLKADGTDQWPSHPDAPVGGLLQTLGSPSFPEGSRLCVVAGDVKGRALVHTRTCGHTGTSPLVSEVDGPARRTEQTTQETALFEMGTQIGLCPRGSGRPLSGVSCVVFD